MPYQQILSLNLQETKLMKVGVENFRENKWSLRPIAQCYNIYYLAKFNEKFNSIIFHDNFLAININFKLWKFLIFAKKNKIDLKIKNLITGRVLDSNMLWLCLEYDVDFCRLYRKKVTYNWNYYILVGIKWAG